MSKLFCGRPLEKLLGGVQLPALPQSAMRLLELSQDDSMGPAEYAVPIEADPGLTGQVLRFVNSSYFGFVREVSSVKLAITLVGVRTIKNFALWSAVFSLMPNPKCGQIDLKTLWQDSLRRALFARRMGKLLGMKEAEDVFAAALLQDMALPLLVKEAADAYARLLEARDHGRHRLTTLEQQAFGWTHAQAGAMLARHWKLPDELATLIQSHAAIDEQLASSNRVPGRIAVALSALLPAIADGQWFECAQFLSCYQRVRPDHGPNAEEVLAAVDQDFASFAPVLKITTPSKSLVDWHAEACAVAV